MKLATWNVNSIKARQGHVLRWVGENTPDVLMIQELKGIDIPGKTEFEALDYSVHSTGQKTYNGVATFSKHPVDLIHEKLPGFEEDPQARYQEMDIMGIRVLNIYLPNGNPVSEESEKFPYKLEWMSHLHDHLKTLREDNIPFLIAGDFNIIPDEHDCYDPKVWRGDALFHHDSLALFRKIINLGLNDAFRIWNQESAQYTFWDYQGGAYPANKGIRIDHFLLSPALTDRAERCTIDSTPRGWEKPSDHVPVILELSV